MTDPIAQNERATTQTSPWLAALLLARREQFFARWTHIYHQLAALPRNTRRRLRKQAATSLLGVALLISLGKTPTLQAANLTVTPGAVAFFGGDGCSLAEAIVNANNDAAIYGDCLAGSGADTITLSGNTYSYTTATSSDSKTALPEILSDITIEGGGATIERTPDTFDFRILKVSGANGKLTLNDAIINGGNSADESGGGIFVDSNNIALINDSTIQNNNTAYFGGGGGIFSNSGSTLTLNNSTISGNSATTPDPNDFLVAGGILAGNDTTLSLMNTHVDGNFADYAGGGIVTSGVMTLTKSTISNNFATSSGGAMVIVNSATVAITDSTISNNSTVGFCGGINSGGDVTLLNSTVSNNTAEFAGGVCIGLGSFTVQNSTISGNSASIIAGGIYDDGDGVVTITRSIVSGNFAATAAEIYSRGTITSDTNLLGQSDFTNLLAFEGFTPSMSDLTATSDGTTPTALSDILETTLADNGGPTFTHALVAGSPAIDVVAAARIPAATCTAGELDQRGEARANGPNQGGTACDLGAYEFIAHATAVALQAVGHESRSAWLLTALSSLLATLSAWLMRRKNHPLL